VPSLADAIAAAGDLLLALDIKDPRAVTPTLSLIRELGLASQVRLWSSRDDIVTACVEQAQGIEVTLLRDTPTGSEVDAYLRDALALGARGVNVTDSIVDQEIVEQARGLGLVVYSGFSSHAAQERVLATGIELDGFTTDYPAEARLLLEE
jgi:hypothetical protein